MKRLVFGLLLLAALPAPAQAAYQDGLAAYDRGDYATAFREFEALARLGDATSQFNLGLMYQKGWGVPQHFAEAASWYLKAAEQGYARAHLELARMYDRGQGVRRDFARAYMWYSLAASALPAESEVWREATARRDHLGRYLSPGVLARAQDEALDVLRSEPGAEGE